MKRDWLKGFRWGTAVLPAAFLAAAAMCSTALAQTLPPTAPQLPGGMNAEQQRVVAAVHGVGCIPLNQANNTMAPPRLFGGVVQCLASGDYDQAARLFALAGIYMHFDVARVSDRTAGGVAGALPMLATSGASAGQTEGFEQGLHKLESDPAQLQAICNEVAKIGMPSYYPTYMIAGGMGAFIGEPKGGPLVKDFDAPGTWNKLQTSYLQCPSAQGLGQKIKNLLAKTPGVHMNDVAEKIEEIPDPVSGLAHFNPAFSPDGRLLAVLSSDHPNKALFRDVHILDWKTHQLLQSLNVGSTVYAAPMPDPLQFSPDGRLFASCGGLGDDVAVRIWSTATWKVVGNIAEKSVKLNGCDAIAFSADSRLLLRVNSDVPFHIDNIFAYSTENWRLLWSLHDERIEPKQMVASPAGDLMAVAGIRYTKSLEPGALLAHATAVVGLLDLGQKKFVNFIDVTQQGWAVGYLPKWSPDGTRLAILGPVAMDVFDVHSGERVVDHPLPSPSAVAISYCPDGKCLVIGGFTGRGTGFGVQIWDGNAGKLLQTISGDAAGIAISHNSRYLAVAKRGHIEIWQFKQSDSGDSTQR